MKSLAARFALWSVLITLLVIVPPATGQDAEIADQAQALAGHETPEAAFAAARDAFNARDWEAFVETVSPARRDEIIGQMAVAFAGMAKQPGSDPRLGVLVDEYLPRNFDPMDLMMSDDAQAQTIRLAKRMGDPEGFFVEAMSLVFSMQYSTAELASAEDSDAAEDPDTDTAQEQSDAADETKQTLDAQITAMDELAIKEDRAEAIVTITTTTGNQSDRWTFEQYEGRWYLSMR